VASVFLGIDIGTSSVKAALWDAGTGTTLAIAHSPDVEMPISSPRPGWAEQDPMLWWDNTVAAIQNLPAEGRKAVQAIGITYQMHGLVLLDADGQPTRPAIIWCDSRAVPYGEQARQGLGEDYCRTRLLNSPGNFTAAKLRWVIENEPDTLRRSRAAMLPGDYVAFRLTGEALTTPSGLSEMVLWDFEREEIADEVLRFFQIPGSLVPPLTPTFGPQGHVSQEIAAALGIPTGRPVTYRAGDQPNNAFSLGCLDVGEVAATAGTSGVVYGVTDTRPASLDDKVNTFVHVNHMAAKPRYGVLLCVNGCGSLMSWLKNSLLGGRLTYREIDQIVATAQPGSDGLLIFPFGNGAERIFGNKDVGAAVKDLHFARHGLAHICRAAQEGIAFSLCLGMEGAISATRIRAGNANLFLSPVFAQTFSTVAGTRVEIVDVENAAGAARGAAVGFGYFRNPEEACQAQPVVTIYDPDPSAAQALVEAYANWKAKLPV